MSENSYSIPKTWWLISLVLIITPLTASAQKLGHYLKGDQVIFVFSPQDYETFTRLKNGRTKDPARVKVKRVCISGNFNNWDKDGVPMDPLGDGVFVLSQPLSIFKDELTWDFKYLVNGKYWAEPDASFRDNVVAGTFPNGDTSYFLQLNTFRPDIMGNTLFRLPGHTDAREVILTGTFNSWNNHTLPMEKTATGWRLALDLEPGFYQYKFIVDGVMIEDPLNDDLVRHDQLGPVSVIKVTKEVRFFLNTHLSAQNVAVAGTFNNWQPDLDLMEKTEDGWEIKLELPEGKHYYRFVVDDAWITDPTNPVQEYDDEGHVNSVIIVN
ncbi:early set domain-containing protein [Robertkochia flava]|uniref:hypothetical protein n=1 Tax=Robertkochia flava TaxID=3447986 RepID=UPI001CC9055F|nr:hypothetical protein [Robertkochia marina]